MNASELLASPLAGIRRGAAAAPRRAAPRPDALPSLVSSGYVSIVPDRLASHLRVMLGADYAQIHARDPDDPDALIVVATSGCDAEVVGSRVPVDNGVVTH